MNRMKPLDTEEVKKLIKQRLLNGWMIVEGDGEMISYLEEKIYTPGTDRNELFQCLMMSLKNVGKIYFLYLSKKDSDLRKFLEEDARSLSDIEFENLLICRLDINNIRFMVNRPDLNIEETIDMTIQRIFWN